MAAPIVLATRIDASPEAIFEALSTGAGLRSFWTTDSQAEPVVGSVARFGFPTGSRVDMRVDELAPGRRVAWTSLGDLLTGPNWKGTTLTWDLRKTESGSTEVLLQHGNWPEDMPHTELAATSYNWARILRALKGYAETGTWQPVFAMGGR